MYRGGCVIDKNKCNFLHYAIVIALMADMNVKRNIPNACPKMSFHSYRATYMMEDCEARNDELRQTVNTTLHQLNTTGLNPQQVEWLKGNTTNNVTSGLQKCDIQAFLTDVRVDVNSVMLSPWPDLFILRFSFLFFFFFHDN